MTLRTLTHSEAKFALVFYPSDGCVSILETRKLVLEGESKYGPKQRESKFRVQSGAETWRGEIVALNGKLYTYSKY